ncbi:MAG: 1,4-alpha-glucan branching protein GlgB [Myxococcota bacterium]
MYGSPRGTPQQGDDGVSVDDGSISDLDLYLFHQGRHFELWRKLGAHVVDGGVRFAVWAPNAKSVAVVGERMGWETGHALTKRSDQGVWEGVVPGAERGDLYKYAIEGAHGQALLKADPMGFQHEAPPKSASVVATPTHVWGDGAWMEGRAERQALEKPISLYEVHLGSWRLKDGEPVPYAELADPLADHVEKLGFTHVELLPVLEHPFAGSWGYQVTGYFAPTARHGSAEDFMAFVDRLHQRGIGVILDWVPAHFPSDGHGLATFDGTALYEHADPREGYHPEWKTHVFNYGRHEVRSFLISSASYWLEHFHLDGIRVDGVASMLYRDYAREPGTWVPNKEGGRENLEAVDLLQQLNDHVHEHFPGTLMIAEESTDWPRVTRPSWDEGLGFDLKWDLGWMHDTLAYLKRDPIDRRPHHDQITFRTLYAFHEQYMLPLSHDEVVHGKSSLLGRMPGDDWKKFANLRLLYSYQWATPGKKLLFMGGELAMWREWDEKRELDWWLLEHQRHRDVAKTVEMLNAVYKAEAGLHEGDCDAAGFEWISGDDRDQSVLLFLRWPANRRFHAGGGRPVLCAFNFTPVPRHDYPCGVPFGGAWDEIYNSDSVELGGSGVGNLGRVGARPGGMHGRPHHVALQLPPLGAVFLAPVRDEG